MNIREMCKKYDLLAIVFLTGTAGLIIEVTAVRILSVSFGNTIYTVSGVVGVILAALSAGYARGGVRADRLPTRNEFFRIIEKAGMALVVLFLLMTLALPTLANLFPLSWGPLLVALLLFFVPSYFLGMLSPFVIKLEQLEQSHAGIGTISGKVFFWSTCGSIVGTLLTAFVLIPFFGLNAIIVGTAFCILLLGSIGRIVVGNQKERAGSVIVLVISLIVLLSLLYVSMRMPPDVLFSRDGVYQHMVIKDGEYAGRPARFFYQDRSEDDLAFLDGNDLAAPYTKYYALYKLFNPNLKRALFIGGGTYSMPTALHRDLPDAQIDIAEIEPSLFQLAQTYFNAPNDPHLANHIEDGRHFLEKSSGAYDMIFSDVYYSLYSVPPAYTTREYVSALRKKLAPNGLFIANLLGGLTPDKPSFILSEIHTVQSVFPETYVFAVDSTDIPNAQNIIVVGVNSANGATTSSLPVPASIPHPLPPDMFSHLVPLSRYDLNDYPILTDNYAPVEYMTAKILNTPHPLFTSTAQNGTLWNGERAMNDIASQLSFGARSLGTPGHQKTVDFIKSELAKTSAVVTTQQGTYRGPDGNDHPLTNIIARFDPSNPKRIIVGTHYDSIVRAYADQANPNAVMPGANNSASGVALLLETARVLDSVQRPSVGIDFVFFDGEEGAKSLGAGDPQWSPLGSPYFTQHLTDIYPQQKPERGAIFDMVCDKHLDIPPERSSLSFARANVENFWDIGRTIAPSSFLRTSSALSIGDDHTALNAAGIPSFLVIDFDYQPWFNTTQDTIDKCSAESLQSVGRTLLQYLYTK